MCVAVSSILQAHALVQQLHADMEEERSARRAMAAEHRARDAAAEHEARRQMATAERETREYVRSLVVLFTWFGWFGFAVVV